MPSSLGQRRPCSSSGYRAAKARCQSALKLLQRAVKDLARCLPVLFRLMHSEGCSHSLQTSVMMLESAMTSTYVEVSA